MSADSRLSLTNRADRPNGPQRPSRTEILKTPLTGRGGVALREDVRDYEALEGDRPMPWRQAVHEWREYVDKDRSVVFRNTESGEYGATDTPHRFAEKYSDKQYAKLRDLERGISEEYGKRLHTAMLTLTASPWPDGEPIPPVDHLTDLDRSWDAVRRELSRSLESKRWEYLAILEPHQSGYIHVHVAVFVEGVVTESDFAPVLDAHVRNSPYAGHEAHDLQDESTISIRHVGDDRGDDQESAIDELAIYLAEYLGTYDGDPLELEDHVQMANAVLWATGKQRWRPSNGAQRFMTSPADEEEDSPWEMIGCVVGSEFCPPNPSGGVDRFETSFDPPPDQRSGVPAD